MFPSLTIQIAARAVFLALLLLTGLTGSSHAQTARQISQWPVPPSGSPNLSIGDVGVFNRGGVTYRLTYSPTPPAIRAPVVHVINSGTSQVYTPAAGVDYIVVQAWGGGGGGGGSGTGATAGTDGTSTHFGSLYTGYGTGGYPAGGSADGEFGSAGWDFCIQSEAGSGNGQLATAPGGNGACSFFGGQTPGGVPDSTSGGAGGGPKTVGWPGQSGTGCGGSGAASITTTNAASGGAGGTYCQLLIARPASSYIYTIGTAGTHGVAGTSGWNGGDASGGGLIITEY